MDYSSESLIKRLNNLEKKLDKLNNKLFTFNDLSSYVNGYYLSKKELDSYISGEDGGENMLEGDQFEQLDNELKKQKQVIEQKKGTVKMTGSHLIPSDITNGISSIKVGASDTSQTTATPEDVKQGKTFYNADGELVEGTFEDLFETFFYYDPTGQKTMDKTFDIRFPNSMETIRGFILYRSPFYSNVWISKNASKLLESSFSANHHVTIKNWTELTNLKEIHSSALACVNGLDVEFMPEMVNYIGKFGFDDSCGESSGIYLPAALNTIESNCFRCAKTTTFQRLTFAQGFKVKVLPEYMFKYDIFEEPVTIPEGVEEIQEGFVMNGGIKDVTMPTTLKTLGRAIFYNSQKAATETITFLGEVPPVVGTNFTHSTKISTITIYVPDNSVDEYQAVFAGYKVLPMSQKP